MARSCAGTGNDQVALGHPLDSAQMDSQRESRMGAGSVGSVAYTTLVLSLRKRLYNYKYIGINKIT